MKKWIILIVVVICLVVIGGLFLSREVITGLVVEDSPFEKDIYTYTKAICNETNYCEDNEVKCNGREIVSITPITGAVVQFHPDWEDPRGEEERERLC